MATVIYLHGFASVGNSPKAHALREALIEHTVLAPDLPIDPELVIAQVDRIVRNAASWPIVFVGTSLGGFWANYFAQKYDAPCVLVNPALRPSKTLYQWVGKAAKNYATGENVEVTLKDIASFAKIEMESEGNHNGALIHVFAAKDDDVINYQDVLDQVRFSKSLTLTKDGGHRFESHWGMVVDKVNEVIKNSCVPST
jgi:uncharacterized protein